MTTESRNKAAANLHIFKLNLCNKYPLNGICFQYI